MSRSYPQQGVIDICRHVGLFSGAEIELTIDTGVITIIGSNHIINGEGGAADNLDTINGGIDGKILILKRGDAIITVRHGIDNITLPGAVNVVLATNNDMLTLQWCEDDGEWYPQSNET